jgi:hypothetical protein
MLFFAETRLFVNSFLRTAKPNNSSLPYYILRDLIEQSHLHTYDLPEAV